MTGSLQLRDYPSEIVRLSCEKCGRAGQYRKQTLIERYGADMRLPDLREEIAQCSRMGQMHDACMVRYFRLGLTMRRWVLRSTFPITDVFEYK